MSFKCSRSPPSPPLVNWQFAYQCHHRTNILAIEKGIVDGLLYYSSSWGVYTEMNDSGGPRIRTHIKVRTDLEVFNNSAGMNTALYA